MVLFIDSTKLRGDFPFRGCRGYRDGGHAVKFAFDALDLPRTDFDLASYHFPTGFRPRFAHHTVFETFARWGIAVARGATVQIARGRGEDHHVG